ncbi:MAG: ECF-type sigma factor [Verrucomicrobiales bacterium]
MEAAELLGISERTAKRTWAYSRAWLFEELNRKSRPAGRLGNFPKENWPNPSRLSA